ncbi:unnamed protein product, partial [Cladocopium goreaui]
QVSAAKVLPSSSSSVRASGTAVHGRTEAPETCPYKRSSADESGDAKRCSNEAAHRTQPRPEVHLSKLDDEARRSSPDTNFLKAEDRHFIRHHAGAREKERVGLKLALFTAEVISVCMRHG